MDDGQENAFLAFEEGRSLEDRMLFDFFLTIVFWEDESKFLFGPNIFFELGDELEGRWFVFDDFQTQKKKNGKVDDEFQPLNHWNMVWLNIWMKIWIGSQM